MPAGRSAFPAPLIVMLCAQTLAACSSSPPAVGSSGVGLLTDVLTEPNAVAVARMMGVGGSRVEGTVSFTQYGSIVVVRARFIGMEYGQAYGLHVHEKGDCRGDNASAAGGHFNPGGAPHGRPGRGAHHAGDLPNMQADGEGNIVYAYETSAISLGEGPVNVSGRSAIVSRDPDDYQTQPDGNSGPPLACGFIRLQVGIFGLPLK